MPSIEALHSWYKDVDMLRTDQWRESPFALIPVFNEFNPRATSQQDIAKYNENPLVVRMQRFTYDLPAIRTDPDLYAHTVYDASKMQEALLSGDPATMQEWVNRPLPIEQARQNRIKELVREDGTVDFSSLRTVLEPELYAIDTIRVGRWDEKGSVIPQADLKGVGRDIRWAIPAVSLIKGFYTNPPTYSIIQEIKYAGKLMGG